MTAVDAALKALAEPRRRAILRLVWSQELPATDIADQFPDVTRPAISQHLAVLKDAELVTERRDGTRRLYRANTRHHGRAARVPRRLLDRPASSACATSPRPRRQRPASDSTERQEVMAELVREIMIDATPETIWPFLTDPASTSSGSAPSPSIDPRPGGVYRVLVRRRDPVGRGVRRGRARTRRWSFTFGWDQEGHPIPPGSTTVEITLHPEGDKTLVRLVHRGLPDDAVGDHTQRLGSLPRSPGDRRDRRQCRARHARRPTRRARDRRMDR